MSGVDECAVARSEAEVRRALRVTVAVILGPILVGVPPTGARPHGVSADVAASTVAVRSAGVGCQPRRFTRDRAGAVLRLGSRRLATTARSIGVTAYPSVTGRDRVWHTTPASGWTSGFFPGSLWLAHRHSHDPELRRRAVRWTRGLAGQALDTSTHDVGFQLMSSFGNGFVATRRRAYRDVLIRGARSLASRYDPAVRAVRSWGPRDDRAHFRVVVDSMMNLDLLLWAARNGGPRRWRRIAVHHAETVAAHFLRRDGSVRHLVDFDPATGGVLAVENPQGYRPSSTWARGQAWALHGFAAAYAQTRQPGFLGVARRTAHYYLAHVPPDCVPYWDFDAPGIPRAPRDSSAAAIAADGLADLAKVDPSPQRRARESGASAAILRTLADRYVAPFGQAVLRGGVDAFGGSVPPDIGTSYGDYYLLRAVETWLGRR